MAVPTRLYPANFESGMKQIEPHDTDKRHTHWHIDSILNFATKTLEGGLVADKRPHFVD